MSVGLARRVIDALDEGFSDVESICVHFYGGEPLVNLPAIAAMLERSQEKSSGRFSWAITTNGTVFSEAAINLLRQGEFQVILSVDGPPEIHDEHRRTAGDAPTHARVMEFLDALRSRTKCWIRGSSVVRSGWRLSRAVEYLRSLPVDAIKAQAVRGRDGIPGALSSSEKAAYLQDLELVGAQIVAELEEGKVPRDDRFSSRVLQLLTGIQRDGFCNAGDTTFGITPEGEILPCVLITAKDGHLGWVSDTPSRWREMGHQWRSSRPLRRQCHSCAALPLCGGGCPAILPVCGADECDLVRKNCEVAASIYEHFRSRPEALLTLAGIS
jgi:uncharacterized protein